MCLLITKAKAHVAISGHASDAVGDNFRRARALYDSLPGSPLLLAVTFGEWSHYVTRGPLVSAARLAREIRLIAEQSGDALHHLYGCYASGMTETVMGHFAVARAFLEEGLRACAEMNAASYIAPAVGDPKAIMQAYLALIDLCEGRLEESRRNMTVALQAAHETKLTYSIALTLLVRVTIAAFDSAVDPNDGELDALRDFASAHGMAFFESIEMCLRGWARARRGEHDAGLALLDFGLHRYRATQSGVWVWTFLRMKAEVLGWKGKAAEALATLDEADAAARRVDAQFEIPVLARARAELLALAGRREAALAEFDRAAASAHALGAPLFARQAMQARRRLFGDRPAHVAVADFAIKIPIVEATLA